jgi:hypothetical protein
MPSEPYGALPDSIRPVVSAAYDLAKGVPIEDLGQSVQGRFAYMSQTAASSAAEKGIAAQSFAQEYVDYITTPPGEREGMIVPAVTGASGFIDIAVRYPGEGEDEYRIVRQGFQAGVDPDSLWNDIVNNAEEFMSKYGLGGSPDGLEYTAIGVFYT